MDVAPTVADLNDALAGEPCVLVPTMGALHGGHLQLLEHARRTADERDLVLAASIFVNPDQFNDPSDLLAYPRPLADDLSIMLRAGVEVLFTPSVEAIYPSDDPDAAPQPDVPPVGTEPGLEDRFRPGHFAGVCRVVSRLFDLFAPDAAVFGEKDWQQFRVVTDMARAQGRSTEIIPCPTAREEDGVAMSSRNTLLSAAARPMASAVSRAIETARGLSDAEQAEVAMHRALVEVGLEPEYAAIRDAETLVRRPGQGGNGPWRVLVAARLNGVRLLDNAPWPAYVHR